MVKTSLLKIISGIGLVIILSQCALRIIPVEGSGDRITTHRTVEPFTEIEASGKLDMALVSDSLFTISIEGHENLMPHIKTEVKNNRLIIGTTAPIRSQNPPRVMVTLPVIDRLELSRFGTVATSNQLSAETFTAVIRESGPVALDLAAKTTRVFLTDTEIVRVKGTTHTVEATLYGRSRLDSRALTAKVGRANVYGPSKYAVFASKVLFANVDGPGEITYFGQPEEVNRVVRGSGQITAGVMFPLN